MRTRSVQGWQISVAAVAAAIVTTACSSSTASHHANATTTSTRTPSTASSAPVDPSARLFTTVASTSTKLTSAHVDVTVLMINQQTGKTVNISATGVEAFAKGKVTTGHLSVDVDKQRGQVIVDHATVYVRAAHPADAVHPWLKVDLSAQQAHSPARALLKGLATSLTLGSPNYVLGLRLAASDVRMRLPAATHGIRTTPYAMDVDPAKVDFGHDVIAHLAQPVNMTAEVNLDGAGRVVELQQEQNDGPTSFHAQTTYGDFNAKVAVTPPPANQVAT